jgi:mono/diheme cytochrome c family protein
MRKIWFLRHTASGVDAMRVAQSMGWLVLAWVTGGGLFVADVRAEAESGQARLSNGKNLYLRNCAGCHGTEGKGDGYKLLGPDPANLASQPTKQKSDTVLLKTIHEGKPNMPSWKLRLSEQDSRDVLAYVRTLAR